MVSVTSKHLQIAADSPADVRAWLTAIESSRNAADIDLIRRASELSQRAHEGQTRISGEAYFLHSLAVANILAELNLDAETISAAMLHDVVEDTSITLEDIREQFGDGVAQVSRRGHQDGHHLGTAQQ